MARAAVRTRSIRSRLIAIILGITVGCLAAGFAVVGVLRIERRRAQQVQMLEVVARAVGDASVARVALGDDQPHLDDVLDPLAWFPDIEHAALYGRDGALIEAHHDPDAAPRRQPPEIAPRLPHRVEELEDVTIVRTPIVHQGERYGTLELVASNAAVNAEIRSLVQLLGGTLLAMGGLSILAAWVLQRRITRPIFDLAALARRVGAGEGASARAPDGYPGEIGTLADTFNSMFATLEERERELVTSRNTLRALIDASPAAVIGVAADHTVTFWSSRAAEAFGVAEAAGRRIEEILPAPTLEPVWRRCLDGPVVGLEVDLGARVLSFSSAPLPDDGTVVIAADVTERRRAAEALAERAAQLERSQKMEVVGRLAGGVAHDFNNLLTIILASCQILKRRAGGDPELGTYVLNIQTASQRGAALIRRLLAFSRPRSLDPRPVDARAVLREIEKLVRIVVGEHVEVAIETCGEPCVVVADRGQLEQVLLNLALNGRDAMPTGGNLTLRARTDGDRVALAVTDTGVGMTAEVRERVFEPFFTTKIHGTGLGLATCYQVARALDGEITVESEVDRGTTFTLWLPRFTGDVEIADVSAALPVVPPADTVLLVEDEPAVRNLVQIILAEAGYHVIVATTPQEALALGSAPGVHVDLLLTDVVMPSMSGPQLATELLRRAPEVEVLYMTGYAGDELTQRGLDESAATLLHKPFKPDQLLRAVRELLDARPAQRARRASEALFGAPDSHTA